MLCREQGEISLTVLLGNCHDVTGRIFDRWISRQTGMKSPLKWHNQPGQKMTFSKSKYLFILHQSVAQNLSDMWRSTFEIGAA